MSAIFLVYALSFLLNCMIEYKYHIQENFDHAPLYYTYLDRKIELGVVMWYLGIGACYLCESGVGVLIQELKIDIGK